MPIIVVSGPAVVFDCTSEEARGSEAVVEDAARLATLDGLEHSEEFSDYLGDGDDQTLMNAGVTGGRLIFKFDSSVGRLFGTTEYAAPRALTDHELALLKEYTIGQWSDGIGSNFFQLRDAQDALAPQLLFMDESVVSIEQRS